MITIKRYNNRKLYNTDLRQYVTLDDIAAILNDGGDIRVVDHRSGVDLTTLTLLQVILEQERQIGGLLPSVLVSRVVKSGDQKFHQLVQALMAARTNNKSFDNELHQRLHVLISNGQITPAEADHILELLNNEPEERTAGSVAASFTGQEVTVDDLQEQLRLLQVEINQLKHSQPKQPPG